jgi:hypothetical protein
MIVGNEHAQWRFGGEAGGAAGGYGAKVRRHSGTVAADGPPARREKRVSAG